MAAATTALICGTATLAGAQEIELDRERVEAVLVALNDGSVPLEELTAISVAAPSPELRRILEDLTRARGEVRALRERYLDDYPPIRDRLETIAMIEDEAIPRVVRGILREIGEAAGR